MLATMDVVHFKSGKPHKNNAKELTWSYPNTKKTVQSRWEHKACPKCGKSPCHPAWQCPAKNAECNNCGKQGHYGKVCSFTTKIKKVEENLGELLLGKSQGTMGGRY